MRAGAACADAEPPSVKYKCTPDPQDCTGWFRSPVSIAWTVLPADAKTTGCEPDTLSTDTPATNEYCRAEDANGIAVTVELKIKVDMTPPGVLGGTPSRA